MPRAKHHSGRSHRQPLRPSVRWWLVAFLAFAEVGFAQPWKQDAFVTQRFTVSGTGDRNNPLRRPLESPFNGDELYVRMRLEYAAESIDTPDNGDGEFIVLWLDEEEGGTGSTHAGHVPNIGIHVQDRQNHFMVRYGSGGERFGPRLEGDREYLIVGRLWKSRSGPMNHSINWISGSTRPPMTKKNRWHP